jgi:hypothetical protein
MKYKGIAIKNLSLFVLIAFVLSINLNLIGAEKQFDFKINNISELAEKKKELEKKQKLLAEERAKADAKEKAKAEALAKEKEKEEAKKQKEEEKRSKLVAKDDAKAEVAINEQEKNEIKINQDKEASAKEEAKKRKEDEEKAKLLAKFEAKEKIRLEALAKEKEKEDARKRKEEDQKAKFEAKEEERQEIIQKKEEEKKAKLEAKKMKEQEKNQDETPVLKEKKEERVNFREVKVIKKKEKDVKFTELYIYKDAGYRENKYLPTGWMGDTGDLRMSSRCFVEPKTGTSCIKIGYSARQSQGNGWAGIYWQNPANNWGTEKKGFDLTGAKKLKFYIRGEKGGEIIDSFKVGGITGTYSDTADIPFGPIILTKKWTKYEIDLKGYDLSHIIGGFCFAVTAESNPESMTFYLDEIVYE